MGEGYAIPAAHIQDVDLSAIEPALAAEISRLGALMERGEETDEQFSQLIRLLVRAGRDRKAEYLLRRNIEGAADGQALYRELFGTAKVDEFAAAVKAFSAQFGVGLELMSSRGFLDSVYRMSPGPLRTDAFELLASPCEVRFDYSDPEVIAADVSAQSDMRYLLLRWANGDWQR